MSIVEAQWLLEHQDDNGIVILDASIDGLAFGLTNHYPNQRIPKARLFDFVHDFADTKSPLPNTLPSPEVFEQKAKDLGICNASTIVVYDNMGIFSAPRAWWMFEVMGHKKVLVLHGGLKAYVDAGGVLESNGVHHAVQMGDFKAQFRPELYASCDEVIKSYKNDVLVDARSPARFNAQEVESRAGLRSGHIPHSKNVHYKSLLNDGFFKSKSTLQKLLPRQDDIIFTCGSGVSACILRLGYTIAHDNDQNLKIYDGSWSEWGATDLPIS